MRWIANLLIAMLVALATPVLAQPAPSRDEAPDLPVLLVVSSHGADNGKTRPGYEMDELSQAWVLLRRNGFAVEIASPRGGAPVADEYDPGKPYVAAFLADPEAVRQLAATRTVASVRDRDYAAVFVIGGKGAMFDLVDLPDLQRLLAETYDEGRVVAGVCHGPAALVNVRLRDGRALIAGREVAGFTDEEEGLFGKTWSPQFPFLLESELRRRGARFTGAPMMLTHVAVDGRVITGQNPYSTAATTEAIVRALGRDPVRRAPWVDERSMHLVAGLAPDTLAQARAELAANPAGYDVPLIAIWGYYQAASAADRKTLTHALMAMELALPHYDQPQLRTAIAEAKVRLGAMER